MMRGMSLFECVLPEKMMQWGGSTEMTLFWYPGNAAWNFASSGIPQVPSGTTKQWCKADATYQRHDGVQNESQELQPWTAVFFIFFCFSFNINTNLFICLFIYFLSEKLAIQLLLKIRGEMKMIFIWSTLLGLVSTVYQEWSSRLIGRSSTKCCKWWLGTYLILFVFRNT